MESLKSLEEDEATTTTARDRGEDTEDEINMEHHDALLASLPPKARQILLKCLDQDDILKFVEQPSFWRSNASLLVVSVLGTIGCLIALLLQRSWWLYLTMFPATLIITLVGLYFHKNKFYALSHKGVVINPMWGDVIAFRHTTLVSTKLETNYLHCMKELLISRKVPTNPIPKQECISGLPTGTLLAMQEFLEHQLPLPA